MLLVTGLGVVVFDHYEVNSSQLVTFILRFL